MFMKAKKWALSLGLVIGQLAMATPATQAQVVLNSWNTNTATFLDTCSGEVVNLVINTHGVVRLVRTDPDGTQHFRTVINIHGSGLGTSGDRYVFNGSTQREHSAEAGVCAGTGVAVTYTRLISQGSSGNRYLRSTTNLVRQVVMIMGVPTCVLTLAGPPTIEIICHG
jgi:hypothetical protein